MKSPTSIRYVMGDATKPSVDGPAIIAHICNDIGAWGGQDSFALFPHDGSHLSNSTDFGSAERSPQRPLSLLVRSYLSM